MQFFNLVIWNQQKSAIIILNILFIFINNQQKRFQTNQSGFLKKINDYLIDTTKQIGKGQYGEVYESWYEKTPNIKVACKMIPLKTLKHNISIQQIIDEGKLMIKAQGQYVVPIIEITHSQNNIYIFTQLCNGGDLAGYLDKNSDKLNESSILNIFKMICIGYYNSLYLKNIIHRDIKLENILIHDGIPLIADFGFAKSLENIEDMINQSYKCTPMYGSPQIQMLEEQCCYSYQTDIYSLGILLYQMLYGFAPGKPTTKTDIYKFMKGIKKSTDYIDFPANNKIKVSDETQTAIRKMLEYYEENRMVILDLINHKMFKIIEIEDQNQYRQDDEISQSIQKNLKNLQESRHVQITKIRGNQIKEKGEEFSIGDVDNYYIFVRNLSIFSNIILSNLYHVYKQCIQIYIPEIYLDFILMTLSKHYYLTLNKCLQNMDKKQMNNIPFNSNYQGSEMYNFTKANINQEYNIALAQYKQLKDKMFQKIEVYNKKYTVPNLLSECKELKAFLSNDQQIEEVVSKYKQVLSLIIPFITKAINNIQKNQEIYNHQTFFKTIYSMFIVHSTYLDHSEYNTFKFDNFYEQFNRTPQQCLEMVKKILMKDA